MYSIIVLCQIGYSIRGELYCSLIACLSDSLFFGDALLMLRWHLAKLASCRSKCPVVSYRCSIVARGTLLTRKHQQEAQEGINNKGDAIVIKSPIS